MLAAARSLDVRCLADEQRLQAAPTGVRHEAGKRVRIGRQHQKAGDAASRAAASRQMVATRALQNKIGIELISYCRP